MHFVTACVCVVASVLYGHRTGVMFGGLSRWERVARAGIGLVLSTLVLGFLRRGALGQPFEWTHWLIFASLCATTFGYVGLLIGSRRRP